MKIAKGPRPWPIWLFAFVSTAFAVNGLYTDLSDHMIAMRHLWWAPSSRWSEEELIVVACAAFTIKLIPIVWIWVFASRFARWFILAMTLLPILVDIFTLPMKISLLRDMGATSEQARNLVMLGGVSLGIAMAAVSLLFLPPSNRWFARSKGQEADEFE